MGSSRKDRHFSSQNHVQRHVEEQSSSIRPRCNQSSKSYYHSRSPSRSAGRLKSRSRTPRQDCKGCFRSQSRQYYRGRSPGKSRRHYRERCRSRSKEENKRRSKNNNANSSIKNSALKRRCHDDDDKRNIPKRERKMLEFGEPTPKKRKTFVTRADVGFKYEVTVTIIIAAALTTNPKVENYCIFTNLEDAVRPFDDVIAKVFFKGKKKPYAFVIQVKHNKGGEKKFDVAKYFAGYNEINKKDQLKEVMGDIPVSHINFCYFCIDKPKKIGDYNCYEFDLISDSWRSALSFQNCYKLSRKNRNQIDDKQENFLQNFYLYFNQPDIENIKNEIRNKCNIRDETGIVSYVTRFFANGELSQKGLSKEVFETELLKIRLSHKIMPLDNIIQLNDLPVAIWKDLEPNVTIVKTESNIEKILFGRLAQMLNYLLNNVLDWNKYKEDVLDSAIIDEFKKLFTINEPVRVRHWINYPSTLESLIEELWKCDKIPLILKGDEELSFLKDFRHLNKKYIVITDDLISRRREIEEIPGLSVLTNIKDIQNPQRNELLEAIRISLNGRKPIALSSTINGHDELAEKLSYSQILHLVKSRKVYLRKDCLEGDHNFMFLIEDPKSLTKHKIDNIKKGGNITIRCRSDEVEKNRKQIEENSELQNYTIFHCAVSSENENFILKNGDKSLLADFFVDQYGESVYNLEKYPVPILGHNLRRIRQNYIPRSLHTPLVSESLFASETKGICFFSGDFTYLDVNIKRDMVKMLSSEMKSRTQSSDQNIFIEVESGDVEKYWKEALNLQRPLLHIHVKGNELELRKYKNWQNINAYISYTGGKISDINSLTETTDQITILTGEPGIGKSSLLRSLFKDHGKEKCILFYDLVDYKVEKKNEILPIDFSLDLILNKLGDARHKEFLSHLYKRKDESVVLLDSFDEVLPSHKEKTLDFIRNLAASDVKIIIASRLIANDILLENFDARIFKVDPLGEEEAKRYMKNCGLPIREEMLTSIPVEFLNNPLHLNLLKTIAENDEKIDLTKINTLDLFKNFMRVKIEQYFEGRDCVPYKKQRILDLHRKLALVRVLGVDVVKKLLNWQAEKDLYKELKLGIVLCINESYPTFIHETFAEYLTADWIRENIATDSAKLIYLEILNQGKHHILDILCEHLELYRPAIALDKEQAMRYASDPLHLRKKDDLARTALHIIATRSKYNKEYIRFIGYIIFNMLRHKYDIANTDDLMINDGNIINYMQWPDFPTALMEVKVISIAQKLYKRIVQLPTDDSFTEEVKWGVESIKQAILIRFADCFSKTLGSLVHLTLSCSGNVKPTKIC